MLNAEERARALEAYKKHFLVTPRVRDSLIFTTSEWNDWATAWELATQQATAAQGKVGDEAKRIERLEEWLEWIARNIGQSEYLLMKGRTEIDPVYAADCRKRGEQGITEVWAAILANGPKSLAAAPSPASPRGRGEG